MKIYLKNNEAAAAAQPVTKYYRIATGTWEILGLSLIYKKKKKLKIIENTTNFMREKII